MRSMAVVLLAAVSGVASPVEYVPMRHPRFDIVCAAVDESVRPIVSGLPAFSGMLQERTTKPVAMADGSYTFDLNALSFPHTHTHPLY